MNWSDKFRGALNQVKDSGASAVIEKWLARELADYGELRQFKLNSRERSIEFHVLLKGEREDLAVFIDEYELLQKGADDYVTIKRARASREWVQAVMRNFMINQPHKIPSQYSSMVKMVLNS